MIAPPMPTQRLKTARLPAAKHSITFEVHAATTPPRAALYLACNHNDWRTDDPAYAFRRVAEGLYRLKLELPLGTRLEYKVTRGTWRMVEVDDRGYEGENHRHTVIGEATLTWKVPHWKDQASAPARARARSKRVRIVGPLPIPSLGRDRELAVYLPPGYGKEPGRRYPVLYLFDGQNLFDPATAFNQDWAVDVVADRLISAARVEPLIVVGVYNGEAHRLSEQSPWRDARFGANGEGHAYLRWLAQDVKSYIDAHYDTLSAPEHTGVGGSSMGGLTALYAAYRYPLVFGRAVVMSPAFWFARAQIFRHLAGLPKPEGSKIYLDCGELETARVHPKRDFYTMARAMADLLVEQGFQEGKDLLWVSDPKGAHTEAAWGRRLGPALEFLFPGPELKR